MKALVTGSRNWPEEEGDIIGDVLRNLLPPGSTVVHGACHLGGADKIAGEKARILGFRVIECPVQISLDGLWPMAGHRRNTRMLKENHNPPWSPIELCIAFPREGSRGTWDMVSKCEREKIPRWVWPTGMQEA